MYQLMLFCLIVSTLLFIFWVFLLFKYKSRYQGMVDDIDGKIFTLKDIYFIGFGAVEIVVPMISSMLGSFSGT